MNDTVPLNWTRTQPETDPKEFRVILSGGGMAGPQQIAQEVPAANEQYRVLLPQLAAGDGYVISFVNTSNEAQEYAKSNAFKIEQGVAPTTTHSSGPVPSATRATNNVPNVNTEPTYVEAKTSTDSSSSSANPFASATPTSGAAQIAAPVVAAGAIAAAIIAAL